MYELQLQGTCGGGGDGGDSGGATPTINGATLERHRKVVFGVLSDMKRCLFLHLDSLNLEFRRL